MRTTFNLTLTITILTLATLGGCPTGAPDINEIGNDEPAAELRQISGTWDGVLNCTFTTTLEGQEPITQTSTQNYTVTFDSDGQPARLPVASLSPDTGAADVDITDIGDAATYTSTTEINGEQITITQTASVTSATYSSTSATVTVEYTFDATGTGFTQTGTGAQTYTFSVSGDSMTYTTAPATMLRRPSAWPAQPSRPVSLSASSAKVPCNASRLRHQPSAGYRPATQDPDGRPRRWPGPPVLHRMPHSRGDGPRPL